MKQVSKVKQSLTIGIVAGEASGDALSADFMRQMNNLQKNITWVGVGGQQMQAEGLQSVLDMSRLSVMGLMEVVKHLADLFKARSEILTAFAHVNIDLFIGIDAPDFNLRLGKKLKPKGIFCVQYVSPSIWAWRENRIHQIKKATHLVLCLFPFELALYEKYQHLAICVGHPLLKTIPNNLLTADKHSRRRELIWSNPLLNYFFSKQVKYQISHLIVVMPGSRRNEIESIFPKMLLSIKKLLIIDENMCFVIPTINHNQRVMVQQYLDNESEEIQQHVVICCDEKNHHFSQYVMSVADLVLLASGTATLEAMLLRKPMVVVYALKPISYWFVKRLVKLDCVALPNILAGEQIVPELIQDMFTADNVSRVIQQNLTAEKYHQQLQNLQGTSHRLREQSNTEPATAVINSWFDYLSNIKK